MSNKLIKNLNSFNNLNYLKLVSSIDFIENFDELVESIGSNFRIEDTKFIILNNPNCEFRSTIIGVNPTLDGMYNIVYAECYGGLDKILIEYGKVFKHLN